MYSYTAYGFLISSPLEIPEFIAKEGDPDVTFRYGPVAPLDPDAKSPYIQVSEGKIYLSISGLARFLINADCEVVIDMLPEADERAVRVYLLGLVMGILLDHRGFMTFHASAVSVPGGCVAFVGQSGAGKSTTAAAFHTAGHAMLTDDILALKSVGGELVAVPGFPRLHLNPDSARFLGESPETDTDADPALKKHLHRITEGFASETLPLRRIYVLETGDKAQIEPLDPREGLKELLAHWNGSKFGMEMICALGPESHLRHCVSVSKQISVHRLRKTQSFSDLADLVRMVEEDVAAS